MRIVIDTEVMSHRIRRALWTILRRWRSAPHRCTGCGVTLNAVERHYYHHSCERCAEVEHDEWEAAA